MNPEELNPGEPTIATLKLAHASAAMGDAVRLAVESLDDAEMDAWLELAATTIARLNADRFEERWNRE